MLLRDHYYPIISDIIIIIICFEIILFMAALVFFVLLEQTMIFVLRVNNLPFQTPRTLSLSLSLLANFYGYSERSLTLSRSSLIQVFQSVNREYLAKGTFGSFNRFLARKENKPTNIYELAKKKRVDEDEQVQSNKQDKEQEICLIRFDPPKFVYSNR